MNKADYSKQKGDDRFYVYTHRRLSDNKPFYVGKGAGNRAWSVSGRNKYWHNTVNKHGYFVEIVFDLLDQDTAYQCEIDTILEFKYFGYPLVNIASGGEGPRGYVHTEEHRENGKVARLNSVHRQSGIDKMRKSLTGRKLSEEHRESISKGNLGKVRSSEYKENLSRIKKSDPASIAHILALVELGRDNTIYTFRHINGEVFTGNRKEFHTLTEIPKKEINKLFSKKNRRTNVYKWSLVSTTSVEK